MGWGWRNMFWLTGLPGWARYGYWGAPWGYWGYGTPYPAYPGPWGFQPPSRESEIAFLSQRARELEEELRWIKERLEELTREGK
ncbi:MAG TPA: hypothetical protein ENF46_01790 [Candidatus Acetothermia bacterium]|nr:hypothetical protein [Candidatus Acetothermia bacterium]